MFPGVSGFHWSPVHLIFLTIFGVVLVGIITTVTLAWWRTVRDLKSPKALEIAWHQDFEDLPPSERRCRHAISGTAPGRTCPRAFDCRECTEHPHFAALERPQPSPRTYGLNYPEGRFYHRGHAWLEPQLDGTVLVGLDDLGSRIAGTPTRIDWPAAGQHLSLNCPAWTMWNGPRATVIRSPIDGEVVEALSTPQGGALRLRPLRDPIDLRHLLSGPEVSTWLRSELDRLQIMLSPEAVGATLADGGVLLEDLPKGLPAAPWPEISAAMFLEP